MKVALVHNPHAGKGDRSAGELQRILERAGHNVIPLEPDAALCERARREDAECVIVGGGDGTLRRVALLLVNTEMPLVPVPLGTANNIARSLGVRGSPEEIVAALEHGRLRALDVGVARGPWGERFFLEGGGIGLVGRAMAIIESLDDVCRREFSDPEDKLHRDLSVFFALAQELPPVGMTVTIDGRESADGFLLFEVLNIRHAGPRIELSAGGEPDDGRLDVVIASVRDREKLAQRLAASMSSTPFRPFLETVPARRVQLRFTGAEFRLDDEVLHDRDAAGEAEEITVDLSVLPGALQVLVSNAER